MADVSGTFLPPPMKSPALHQMTTQYHVPTYHIQQLLTEAREWRFPEVGVQEQQPKDTSRQILPQESIKQSMPTKTTIMFLLLMKSGLFPRKRD